MPRSGTQHLLAAGDYRVAIASVGASLRELTRAGRHLVRPFAADQVRPAFCGAVLAPWPNRVPGGRWTWQGAAHQLPLNEPDLGNALHGLATWLDWQLVASAADRVSLTATIAAQPGYPFPIELTMTWALGVDGVHAALAATNRGAEPAPLGCGIHPYLLAGSGASVDQWLLRLPAASRLEVDDRLRATGLAEVSGATDFRAARPIGPVALDHAYTRVSFVDGWASAELTDADGYGTRLGFSERTPWVQLHTSDHSPEPELSSHETQNI